MNYFFLFIGMCCGVIGAFLMFLITGIFVRPLRSKRRPQRSPRPKKKRETASWLNIFFARLNSSKIDSAILETICASLIKMINNDPNKLKSLTEVKIVPLKLPNKSPLFTDFVIQPNDDSATVSFYAQYQGQPSFAVYCSSSGGIGEFQNLFTVNVQLEFLVRLLVAKISLSFDNFNNAVLNIGNDLVVELEFKPLIDAQSLANQRHVESISNWLSNLILKNLKGKSFPVFSDYNDIPKGMKKLHED